MTYPTDVAVDDDGTLYVSGTYGIRRVDSDGTISTVFDSPSEPAGTTASLRYGASRLTIGPHGDLYFVDTSTQQVRVLVQPGQIAAPFPWRWVVLGVAAVLCAGLGAALVIRRRRLVPASDLPATADVS